MNDDNRFDLSANADALVQHFIENRDLATKRKKTGYDLDVAIYKYHHDGPNGDYGGEGISKTEVVPKIEDFLNALSIK